MSAMIRPPTSAYRPGQDGNGFKRDVIPLPGEPILPKRTNSAFIGTDCTSGWMRRV